MKNSIQFKIDSASGSLRINGPMEGERTIQPGDRVGLIRDQLKVLEFYRDDGRVPSNHLLMDIATYEFILNSKDPSKMADLYVETKKLMIEENRPEKPVYNFHVAVRLGWDVKIND